MKKLIIMVLALSLALFACGKKAEDAVTENTGTTAAPVVTLPTDSELNKMYYIFMHIYDANQDGWYSGHDQSYVDRLMYYLCHRTRYWVDPSNYRTPLVKTATLDALTAACFADRTTFKEQPASTANMEYVPSNNAYVVSLGDRGDAPEPRVKNTEADPTGSVKVTVDYVYPEYSEEAGKVADTYYIYLVKNNKNTLGEFPWAVTKVSEAQS